MRRRTALTFGRWDNEEARVFGLLRRKVDMDGWFNARFLEAALQKLGLNDAWPAYDADGKPLNHI
jgi:sulfonate transport system substrate-binding protein